MKSDKLEQQFREKLQNRTIEPSDKAWDRLDAMLSVAEKRKTNPQMVVCSSKFVDFIFGREIFI